jgi:VCBS repeat-containing protein
MGVETSINNTPQAKDDYFWLRENDVLAMPTVHNYNTSTYTFTFDVMSNDLGGNAKSMFSIEDDWGNPIPTTDTTLLDRDTLDATSASQWEKTLLGNWIRLVNGKVEYKLADPAHSNDPAYGRDINTLGATDVLNDQFVYAIRLGNGTLSNATVHVNLAGANDAPTAAATNSVTTNEDTASAAVAIGAVDPDLGDTLTYSVKSGAGPAKRHGDLQPGGRHLHLYSQRRCERIGQLHDRNHGFAGRQRGAGSHRHDQRRQRRAGQ